MTGQHEYQASRRVFSASLTLADLVAALGEPTESHAQGGFTLGSDLMRRLSDLALDVVFDLCCPAASSVEACPTSS